MKSTSTNNKSSGYQMQQDMNNSVTTVETLTHKKDKQNDSITMNFVKHLNKSLK